MDQLSAEIDDQEQYSRRSCLTIDGIQPAKNETANQLYEKIKQLTTNHLNNDSVSPNNFDYEYDKCHRIGPVKNNKQSVIVKFRSDNFRERLYRAKKSAPRGIKFRVSLTKRIIELIKKANLKVDNIEGFKFAYADANGNLKLLLNQKSNNGKWTLPFSDIRELDDILSTYGPS